MTTATKQAPWEAQIIQQLEQKTADDLAGQTHAVIWHNGDGAATLLHLAAAEAEALVQAEDESTKVPGGEVQIAKLDDLQGWMADHENELLPVEEAAPGTFGDERLPEGQDADAGKLFDVPRVKIQVDDTDPTVLKIAFSGALELDRGTASDADLYNNLKAGKTAVLTVEAHVAGAKTTHRRDANGDVDAVVQTKSLIVHSIDTA